MEEVSLSEAESRYYSDLFLCCDVEKTGKIPMLKATELYRSANLNNDEILEITSLAGIPATALHISRVQFYSCLKLIAAHQASISLRQELLTSATIQLPLPRFSWKESLNCDACATNLDTSISVDSQKGANGHNQAERKHSLSGNSVILQQQQQNPEDTGNSDGLSTDSEIEQNESSCGDGPAEEQNISSNGTVKCVVVGGPLEKQKHHGLSPEQWSTNSDSPTPTNSVAERPWAKETLWQGLLGDEHRQLLGTEEESSDRHSSDDDDVDDIEKLYQITYEQREYYYKQFKTVQPDDHGLLSGHVARMFFEKSRIPVEELRHIWQICDVTRDGALSLEEFIAAMHLVVLRRNNIPLPAVLPSCLHPNVLQHVNTVSSPAADGVLQEPAEADLLHLNDEDDDDNTERTVVVNSSSSSKNIMNASTSATSQASIVGVVTNNTTRASPLILAMENKNISNSPSTEATNNITPQNSSSLNSSTGATANKTKDRSLWTTDVPPTQWTKFSESPTSNVSSPGPKPVNFDMQRTAQAVVSDPQILHPVPLRVTPVAGTQTNSSAVGIASAMSISTTESHNQDGGLYEGVVLRDNSPNQFAASTTTNLINKDTIQSNDLRAIQRPQAKKLLPPKNAGALPPPPQREPSISGMTTGDAGDAANVIGLTQQNFNNNNINNNNASNTNSIKKLKDVPPIPPPRPSHRHGRSSSLDLNKFKITTPGFQHEEITTQASFDLQISTGFADFTQFPKSFTPTRSHNVKKMEETDEVENREMHSLIEQPVSLPPTRIGLQSHQRVSAFEIYRKPQAIPQNLAESSSPTVIQELLQPIQANTASAPFGAAGATAIAAQPQLPNTEHYEKRVNAISDTLRHVSFKADTSMTEILRHLREQNNLLLRLCNDLSDELLTVQTRKEEIRLKLDNFATNGTTALISEIGQIGRTASSISAPVTANITGGSVNSTVMTTTFL